MNGSTESEYLNFAKTKNFQPDTTVLSSGLKVHWLGSKTAEKVLVYFHGGTSPCAPRLLGYCLLEPGGYVLAATPGHLEFLYDLQNELSKTKSISVVVPSYTLAPHAQYPSQLREAAETLSWLLNDRNKKPSDVRSPNVLQRQLTDRKLDLDRRRLSRGEVMSEVLAESCADLTIQHDQYGVLFTLAHSPPASRRADQNQPQ